MTGRSVHAALVSLRTHTEFVVLLRTQQRNVTGSATGAHATHAPVSVNVRSLPDEAPSTMPLLCCSRHRIFSMRTSGLTELGWKLTSNLTSCPGAKKPSEVVSVCSTGAEEGAAQHWCLDVDHTRLLHASKCQLGHAEQFAHLTCRTYAKLPSKKIRVPDKLAAHITNVAKLQPLCCAATKDNAAKGYAVTCQQHRCSCAGSRQLRQDLRYTCYQRTQRLLEHSHTLFGPARVHAVAVKSKITCCCSKPCICT
jgi:hypothetical protein